MLHRSQLYLALVFCVILSGCQPPPPPTLNSPQPTDKELGFEPLDYELRPGQHPDFEKQWEVGGPIEASNQPVKSVAELTVGDFVIVEWHAPEVTSLPSWYRGQVLEIQNDDLVKVHYIGWGDEWDEAVALSRLQLPIRTEKD